MEKHMEDFLPFMDYDDEAFGGGGGDNENMDGEVKTSKFAAYVENVKNSSEWGGQAELLAICKGLSVPIYVYHANMPKVVMGEEYLNSSLTESSILKISFHLHYMTMGEHYNSVRLASSSSEF